MSHCLKWRDRLIGALRELEVGRAEEAAVDQVSEVNGTVEGKDDLPNSQVCVLFPCWTIFISLKLTLLESQFSEEVFSPFPEIFRL